MKSLTTRLEALEKHAWASAQPPLVEKLRQLQVPIAALPGHLRDEDAPDESQVPYDPTLIEHIRAQLGWRSQRS